MPGVAPAIRPRGPWKASSTSTEEGTQRMTTSLDCGERGAVHRLLGAARDEVVDRLAIAMPEHREWIATALHDVLGGAVAHEADAEKSYPHWLVHGPSEPLNGDD